MKASKIIYWIAVLSLGGYIFKSLVLFRLGASVVDALAIGVWLFLWWMLFRRPRAWSLGIGIFLLFAITIQVVLWRIAVASPRRVELGGGDRWLSFALTSWPLLAGALACISLRWFPESPDETRKS